MSDIQFMVALDVILAGGLIMLAYNTLKGWN